MSEFEKNRSMSIEGDPASQGPIVKDSELVEQTLHDSESDLGSKSYVFERFFKDKPAEIKESLWRSFKYLRNRSLTAINASRKRLNKRPQEVAMDEFMYDLVRAVEERRFELDHYGNLKFSTYKGDEGDDEEVPDIVKLAIAQMMASRAISSRTEQELKKDATIFSILVDRADRAGKKGLEHRELEESRILLDDGVEDLRYYDPVTDETFEVRRDGRMAMETGYPFGGLERVELTGPHPRGILDRSDIKVIGTGDIDKDI